MTEVTNVRSDKRRAKQISEVTKLGDESQSKNIFWPFWDLVWDLHGVQIKQDRHKNQYLREEFFISP